MEAVLTVQAAPFKEPVYVDLLTGDAYAVPSKDVKAVGNATEYRVPLYDSPTFVTEGKLLTIDRSWYVESLDAKGMR
jgi:hypothetical protein